MSKEVDDFLAHAGVKGMKWGVRRAEKARLKGLDKASRAKDRKEHADRVQAARDRFDSGRARQETKAAKAEYKAQKSVIGKREAKKILNNVREKNYQDYETSKQFKNGKELAATIALGVAGSILIGALSKG